MAYNPFPPVSEKAFRKKLYADAEKRMKKNIDRDAAQASSRLSEYEMERRAAQGKGPSAAESKEAMKKVADFEAKSKVAREEMLIERAKMRGVSSAAISEAKSKGLDIGNLQPGAFEARKAAAVKGAKRPSGLAPGKSNEQVIAEAKARIASGKGDADWDKRLIAGTEARMEATGEIDRIGKNSAKVATSTAAVKAVTATPPAPVQPSLPLPPPKERYVDPTPAPTTPSEIAQFEARRAKEAAEQKDYDKRYGRKSEPYVHKPLETPKVELRKDILRRLDARVDENFRPDYDDEDGEDPGRPTNRHSIAVDKLRKDLKYAERNGDSSITTKIPSYSEMTLSYEEAHALIGESEGYPEGSVQRGVKESIDKANAVRATLDKPMEVQGSLNGKPFRHVFKTGADANRFIEEQRGWDMDEDDEDFYGRKPESKLKIDRKATVESVPTNKRDKLANQIQKHMNDPEVKAKLPADPFEGFRDKPTVDSLAARQKELSKQVADMKKAGNADPAEMKRLSQEWRKAAAEKKTLMKASEGGKRFDAISSGTGGPGGSGQKRVPAGNPTGGRWTK